MPEMIGRKLRPAEELPESIKGPLFTLVDLSRGVFDHGVEGKREILRGVGAAKKLIVVWTGNYRSDAFSITAGDARKRMGMA